MKGYKMDSQMVDNSGATVSEGIKNVSRPGLKRGRKAFIFTDEMKRYTHTQWIRGIDIEDIAESLGIAVVTLYRKIAGDKDFQGQLRRDRLRRRTKYKKRDIPYWNELISKGAINRRLRLALQWKKFELMNKKKISYGQVIRILDNAILQA